VDLANLVFEPQASRGSAIQVDFCRPSTDVQELNRELRRELHLARKPPGYFVPIELALGSSTRDTAGERRHHLRLVE